MRLYLSSFDLGNQPQRLVDLAGGARRIGVVVNALDHRESAREAWREAQTAKLAALGFTPTELDLRHYFGRAEALREALAQLDAIWINGGNAFILRRAMRQSGFDTLIADALARDAIVYAGFSAAAVIASASLEALARVSDPLEVPPGYAPDIVMEGLGLLPYAVVVHYRSDHPESRAVEAEAAYYERHGIGYRTLSDGEALVIDAAREEIVR
ncbi:MAG TPA: Type 1 glutamine amidotransferase-like domain-containing protein [Paraburkholderia sp.]|uniref:Type 1 glutamine amidotransferase-like domain-containing protein n=1 Tax=Paraburkholderia sp. TaxID=1926495 RepID=UPI002C224DB0|nr:Type 1 glutamine amidotransferase-like domain-containing protein [Paraburkholderia sp.]HTR05449.1 Type 1 glutamine amidotransferase-like domain-containing protein [Paraburkholderia sp.]